jgi:hypothetical protein
VSLIFRQSIPSFTYFFEKKNLFKFLFKELVAAYRKPPVTVKFAPKPTARIALARNLFLSPGTLAASIALARIYI